MVVAPIAGRAIGRVGSERLAAGGYAVAATGAAGMALAASSQSYAALLPGIVAFGVGLAMSTSPITMTAIHDVPQARLGVAAAFPNISRYTGGALGAAVLGSVLHAHLPPGLDRGLAQAAPAGRDLVAEGFRSALVLAAAVLVVAAVISSRMPRVETRVPVAAPGEPAGTPA